MRSFKALSTFQNQLQQTKREIEQRLKDFDHFGLERGHPHESMGEISSYDNHPADDGTELYEREKDIALNEHLEKEYEEVMEALERINQGTYGICTVCGREIEEERLKAIPTAKTCKEHTVNQPIKNIRPVEEEVFMPPWGKFTFDDQNAVVSDAEDIFQDVAQYGTSDGPQDLEWPPDSYSEMYMEANEPIGYVEEFENFIGTDMEGKNVTIFPSNAHEKYERLLDENETMTIFGDLPSLEKEPYKGQS
ncbi:TraR/DksA C4-type zinc finger protein [Bacillus alveayuensis]|jgi:YteA family regulatory protein|uniref:TraR/DksA C4-type zinc finger protein n=1 Tax=Aeribacillus alveayuensis TaxID=279215 RepID=UPI0005D126ED|nr:TraR/DksA C4-type zinc finger protein [Bacillus alveayuensis]